MPCRAQQSPGAHLGRVCNTNVQAPAQHHFQNLPCTLLKPLRASPSGSSPEMQEKRGCPPQQHRGAAQLHPDLGMKPREELASLAFPSGLEGNAKSVGATWWERGGIRLLLIVLRSLADSNCGDQGRNLRNRGCWRGRDGLISISNAPGTPKHPFGDDSVTTKHNPLWRVWVMEEAAGPGQRVRYLQKHGSSTNTSRDGVSGAHREKRLLSTVHRLRAGVFFCPVKLSTDSPKSAASKPL